MNASRDDHLPRPAPIHVRRTLAADVEPHDGQAEAFTRIGDWCFGWRDQRDAVATIEEAAGFGQDADLLAAPATRILRMDDRQ